MRKLLSIALSVLAFQVCLADISDYFDEEILTTDYSNYCISHENTIFLCGTNGNIIKSMDEGSSWIRVKANMQYNYNAIDIFDNTLIAVGNNGAISSSSDNGGTWYHYENTNESSLKGVVLLNSNTGVIVGHSGIVLKTTDKGLDWNKVNSSISEDIIGLVKTKDNTLFLLTQSCKIYKSDNEGDNWELCPLDNEISKPYSLKISKDDKIFIITEAYIISSIDYGLTWESKEIPKYNLFNAYFTNHNTYFCGGTLGLNIVRLNSKGISDIVKLSDNIKYTTGTNIIGFAFINDDTGIAFGNNNTIFKTTNAGESWENISYLNGFYDSGYKSIYFISDSVGFIGSNYETLYKTTDSGTTWKYISHLSGRAESDGQNVIRYLHFFNENTATMLSSAYNGTLLVTYDGGLNAIRDTLKQFNGSYTRCQYLFDSLYFFIGIRYFYDTYHSYIGFKENNEAFRDVKAFDSLKLDGPYNFDNELIFLCGFILDSTILLEGKPAQFYRAVILKSSDFGKNWSRIYFDSLDNIYHIQYINKTDFYAFGKEYIYDDDSLTIIYKTTDSGQSWFESNEKVTKIDFSLKGLNSNYLFGNYMGKKVFSHDSGLNWAEYGFQKPSVVSQISNIFCTDNNIYFTTELSRFYPIIYRMKIKNQTIDVEESIEGLESSMLCHIYSPYPNPARNLINFDIVWDKRFNTEDLRINIYNLFGTKVVSPTFEIISKTINTGILRWNSSGLPSGIYFVELEVGGYKKVQKVVVY